jgi:hypothetical protein
MRKRLRRSPSTRDEAVVHSVQTGHLGHPAPYRTAERRESGSVSLSANIAGAAAAAIANLPAGARRELGKRQVELAQRIRGLVEALGDAPGGKIELELPTDIEATKGEGLGAVGTRDQGERSLTALTVACRLEDWAGPVAGATEIQRDYRIARSTLNRWQHTGEVIALLKETKKHVYPIEQFVDGLPAASLAAISALAANQRVAWLSLVQPNLLLQGRKPIDLLKQDRSHEVGGC